MFRIGEFVIHPTGGICEVKSIGPLEMPGADEGRQYYFLSSLKQSGGKVYVPSDAADLIIRRVMTKEEALELINEIPSIDELDIESDKLRETKYKEAVKSLDCRNLIKMLKTLNSRRISRMQAGKKNTATDEKYFKIAKDNLINELNFVLGNNGWEVQSLLLGKL